MVFGRHDICPSCGTPKSAGGGGGGGERPGDWPCPNLDCLNSTKMVFGHHDACPKCGAPKPDPNGSQDGDWACPNVSCINAVKMVFGRNESCPKCGSRKPRRGGERRLAGGMRPSAYMDPGMFAQPMFARPTFAPQVSHFGSGQPGDWQCSNQDCINHTRLVFGKNESCPSCGTSRNA